MPTQGYLVRDLSVVLTLPPILVMLQRFNNSHSGGGSTTSHQLEVFRLINVECQPLTAYRLGHVLAELNVQSFLFKFLVNGHQ